MTGHAKAGDTADLAPLARPSGEAPQTKYGNLADSATGESRSDKPGGEGKLKGRWCLNRQAAGSGDSATAQERSGMDVPDRSSLPRRASPPQRAALPHSVDATAPLDAAFTEILERGLTELALSLDAPARAAIEAHARLLLAWNEHVNLSGLRTAEQVARGHVLDSLLAVGILRALGRTRPSLLDLGSGGGFPGLPLAVAVPARRAALVDSIGKKAAFLEVAAAAVADALSAAPASSSSPPELAVLAERAEELADEHDQREKWDIVTARAVGSVAEVAELGLPLVHVGGHVVVWKLAGPGTGLATEVAAAARVIQAAGGGTARVVSLPAATKMGLAGHCLVVIRKRRPTPDRYPRSPGERRRRPLP